MPGGAPTPAPAPPAPPPPPCCWLLLLPPLLLLEDDDDAKEGVAAGGALVLPIVILELVDEDRLICDIPTPSIATSCGVLDLSGSVLLFGELEGKGEDVQRWLFPHDDKAACDVKLAAPPPPPGLPANINASEDSLSIQNASSTPSKMISRLLKSKHLL